MYSITTGAEARFGSKITVLPAACLAWQVVPAGETVGITVGVGSAAALWMEVTL
jgi:hypothetical protein